MKETKKQTDFRGLTIFELLLILAVVGGVILWALTTRAGLQNKTYDAERKGRVSALKENLRTYILQEKSFPSIEQFDNPETRKSLFNQYLLDQGEDSLNDPKNKDVLINYITEPENCAPDTEVLCIKASVSLVLSNGQEFQKFAVMPGTEIEYLDESVQDDGLDAEELNNTPLLTPSTPEIGD